MNSSESWKWKDTKQKSVHPTSVCIFCESCAIDKNSEDWERVSEYNLLCKNHPTQRTIHPVSGSPTYALWRKNQETAITDDGAETCETEPTLEFTRERYQFCSRFNKYGKCEGFKKVNKEEEQKRCLSKGRED
jgi:hypothetical protein